MKQRFHYAIRVRLLFPNVNSPFLCFNFKYVKIVFKTLFFFHIDRILYYVGKKGQVFLSTIFINKNCLKLAM